MTDTANFQQLVRRRLERGAPCSLNPDEIAAIQALFEERDLIGEDVINLLHLLADIRAAAGDPTGKLMQPELVERIRAMHDRRDGMALVPREITAETGHKAGMIGDFEQYLEETCPDCAGEGWYKSEECELCKGSGQLAMVLIISWTTIKAIHRRIVEISEAGALMTIPEQPRTGTFAHAADSPSQFKDHRYAIAYANSYSPLTLGEMIVALEREYPGADAVIQQVLAHHEPPTGEPS